MHKILEITNYNIFKLRLITTAIYLYDSLLIHSYITYNYSICIYKYLNYFFEIHKHICIIETFFKTHVREIKIKN